MILINNLFLLAYYDKKKDVFHLASVKLKPYSLSIFKSYEQNKYDSFGGVIVSQCLG